MARKSYPFSISTLQLAASRTGNQIARDCYDPVSAKPENCKVLLDDNVSKHALALEEVGG